jgi:hypothetical protein
VDRFSRHERRESPCPWADRVDQKRELSRRRLTEAHRTGKNPPGRLEHEELTRDPGLEAATLEAQERVRAHRLDAENLESLPAGRPPRKQQTVACRIVSVLRSHASMPIRSCSDSADSARAFAIACTAAAAPEIVVMHGTRATSAASLIR